MALFPAHAGVILSACERESNGVPFPRTCGGDPKELEAQGKLTFFSPHMRG